MRKYVGFWLNLRARLHLPGPWFCERCGAQWYVRPPSECPTYGGTVCEGTP